MITGVGLTMYMGGKDSADNAKGFYIRAMLA